MKRNQDLSDTSNGAYGSDRLGTVMQWIARLLVARGVIPPRDVAEHLHDRFVNVPERTRRFAAAPPDLQARVIAHLYERVERRRSGFSSAATTSIGAGVVALVVLLTTWVTTVTNALWAALLRFSDPVTGQFTSGARGLAHTVSELNWFYLAIAVIGAIGLVMVFTAAKAVDQFRAAATAWIYVFEAARTQPMRGRLASYLEFVRRRYVR